MCIVAGYYLHVIYGLFEGMLRRITLVFGNHVQDESRWHAQLLRRMTLNVPEVRPAPISDELYRFLDELRRFRHLFRNGRS